MKFLSNILINAGLIVDGTTQLNTIPESTIDTDKFLVSDGGVVKYRTGAQVLSDIGAASANGYIPYVGATTNVDLGEFELKAGQFTLDISPTGTAAVGTTRWNNTTGTSETTLKGGTVILKNGVDLVARVVNKVTPNTTLTKAGYAAVRISGAQGQRLAVSYAQANNDNNSADTIGLVTETIATNQEGFIMTVGQLEGINTTGSLQGETWTDGDVLYLSPTIPGAITNIKPSAPQHLVVMGYVEYAHANNGKIYVKIMNGWELGELHDVNTTGAVNGSVLKYNGTIWVPSSDTGITSLNGLTALSQAFATGTSGTDFNIASATATHTFNLPTASATNRGALSSTDWTTFNNKQNALTNPVTGTGTTNTLPKFTGASTIGNSNVTDTGSLITLGSDTYVNGAMGFGTSTLGSYIIRIVSPLTGGTTTYGISNAPVIQSSVTSAASIYRTAPQTQAASFTLSNLNHFFAEQSVIGAGSTVSTQIGFYADNSLIGATNNYGFYGGIPSGTNRWNLYMAGTANNYMGGALGIGATSLTARNLVLDRVITGSTTGISVFSLSTIASDVTSTATSFRSSPSTQAAAFTLGTLNHFQATNATIGAGSSVTTQIGYSVTSLTSATNNYGFVGSTPSGTGRWNLFMEGTADNYLAGNTGIGNSQAFVGAGPILTTTLTDGGSGYVDGTYTDVGATNITATGSYALFTVIVSGGIVTTATLTWGGTTYKAGQTITVSNTLLGGTGSGLVITIDTVDSSILTIASTTGSDITLYRNDTSSAAGENIGTIKWESRDSSAKSSGIGAEIGAFSAGTVGGAYLSFLTRSVNAGTSLVEAMRIDSRGGVGIGATALTRTSLAVSKNVTGSTIAYSVLSDGIIQSDVTSQGYYFTSISNTAAASFTLGSLYHYRAIQGTFGAGSAVTTQIGFYVDGLTGATTNNYGFFGGIASGTGRYNLFMNGTAENYLAGNTGIGGSQLNVSSGPILTTTLTNGGSGYVDGTYTDVLSTAITGNGSYALFTVIVSSGIVTSATLTWSGTTYRAGDTITISNTLLGGTGSGLIITVNTVDSSQLTITSTTGADITLLRNDTTLSPNDNVGTIKWISNDSTTKASGIVAKIFANGDSTNGGAYLSFSTRAGVTNSPLVEAMRIAGSGGVGIGATGLNGYSLRVSKNITGSTSTFGILNDGVVQSDVTTQSTYIQTSASTAAASFTIGSLRHFRALQGTIGAGSTVTNQYGFEVDSSLTGATNNFGFYGNIASGTNRWNIYMNGTANNYLAGNLLIGSTTDAGFKLDVNGTARVQGDTQIKTNITGTATSTLRIDNGGTLGNEVSLEFFSSTTSSTGSNRSGRIKSYFTGASFTTSFLTFQSLTTGNTLIDTLSLNNGNVLIGTGSSINASARLQIDSTTSGFLPPRMTSAQRTAISTPAEGLIVYQTDGTIGLYIYSNATWRSLTMV